MGIELITMLTWNDLTVKNAREIFLAAKDAPCKNWGCKIEGIEEGPLKELFASMREAGKRIFLEVLAIDEETCLNAAKQGAKYGVDQLIGTVYFPSVHAVAKEAGMTYTPFFSLGEDTRLKGTIPEVVQAAHDTEAKGVDGVTFAAFRYQHGDAKELMDALTPNMKNPCYITGSVDCYEKIDTLKQAKNVKAFTIGGAFFEKKFGESFAEQITAVDAYLQQ